MNMMDKCKCNEGLHLKMFLIRSKRYKCKVTAMVFAAVKKQIISHTNFCLITITISHLEIPFDQKVINIIG